MVEESAGADSESRKHLTDLTAGCKYSRSAVIGKFFLNSRKASKRLKGAQWAGR